MVIFKSYKPLLVGLIFLVQSALAQVPAQRPKIGVTLSGGGAKGLAHIGILKAIDSAGLNVDYITGTSMGSIIGSLYAIGYTADSIEKIARSIDWDLLLSNQSSLRSIFMEEKNEYSKYVVELPWQNHRFRLPSGLLQGQELWLKFSELYFPVHQEKDFSRFSIPFRCIGTDVGNGEAIVMKEGEIISAIRSSMAIPSVFTAVDYNGKRMVDGGIVRNFPVRDVKEMGANIVIGSNVASGLLPSEKVRNALQILLQIAFFREAEDARTEVPQCDIYIPFKMEKYNMGSFSDGNDILNLGIEEGRKLYPKFKRLADSLNAIYGPVAFRKNRLPKVQAVTISSFEVHGVEKTSSEFFAHTMDLQLNRSYTAHKLSNMVRQAYGTRYYSRIIYSLQPQSDGTCKIIFDVTENPLTFAKLGIHYNRFTGVGIIANITARNFFITNSRSLVTINIGESFRIRGEHLQYLGRLKNFALIAETQFDRFDVNTYEQYKQDGLYKQNFFKIGERFQFSPTRNFSLGAGHRFEWVHYSPKIAKGLELKGTNNYNTLYGYVSHNSLDRSIYARRGVKLYAEAGRVFEQHPNLNFLSNGVPLEDPDSIQISAYPYLRTTLDVESYIPLGGRTTLLLNGQGGINFNYTRNVLNEFAIGGLTKVFRNQITFAGLHEGTLYTPSVAMLQGGLRVQLFNNNYVTGKANVLFTNFISRSEFFQNPDLLSGYSLTYSYNFALGPLEISTMYSDQTRKLQWYINLGIPF
ncbi:patatin-like phospholipase family protein [Longitalea arenae]|uniref:patatin-like phospholipase family protein n=1 Tax=Longitalea arenae TaxID=2812558 RepID=UPI0019676E92|nr:patatin-like phospholipase family protein [Longitalea arenae]